MALWQIHVLVVVQLVILLGLYCCITQKNRSYRLWSGEVLWLCFSGAWEWKFGKTLALPHVDQGFSPYKGHPRASILLAIYFWEVVLTWRKMSFPTHLILWGKRCFRLGHCWCSKETVFKVLFREEAELVSGGSGHWMWTPGRLQHQGQGPQDSEELVNYFLPLWQPEELCNIQEFGWSRHEGLSHIPGPVHRHLRRCLQCLLQQPSKGLGSPEADNVSAVSKQTTSKVMKEASGKILARDNRFIWKAMPLSKRIA